MIDTENLTTDQIAALSAAWVRALTTDDRAQMYIDERIGSLTFEQLRSICLSF